MARPVDVMRLENISFQEFSVLMYHYLRPSYVEEDSLIKKGLLRREGELLVPTDKGIELFRQIVLSSEMDAEEFVKDDNFILQLRNLFPKGRKEGTGYHWRGSISEIRDKLKAFITNHPEFTKEEILKATANYVASFNGDYTYMQLLKYFIWKVKKDVDGRVFTDSQLLSYLENLDSDNSIGVGDYTSTLR